VAVCPKIDELQAILGELDRFVRMEHAELYRRFRPGLTQHEVDQLAGSLQPYYLPVELVSLYRWHDGWQLFMDDECRFLLPDADFNSLTEAVAQYRAWLEALGSDGWHPLWFPAFGERSGELVCLQLEPDQSAGPVLSFHSDLDLYTSYDSVAALFATTLECWQAGLLPYDPSSLPPAVREIAARHNPLSRTSDGGYRRAISRSSTEGWPTPWKEVLDIAPVVPAADELVVTIEEFIGNPECGRPIRAELRVRGGSFDMIIATATDSTGTVRVVLKREGTDNFRELPSAGLCELWLAPLESRVPLSYLATRIVPL
jgi:cell wall assembly regulator SMI1